MIDSKDAVPTDPDFVHLRREVPRFAVIRLDPEAGFAYVNDRGELLGGDIGGTFLWRHGEKEYLLSGDFLNNLGSVASNVYTDIDAKLPMRKIASREAEVLEPLPIAPPAGDGWRILKSIAIPDGINGADPRSHSENTGCCTVIEST